MFHANTNASLKNLETQGGQLDLAMQNQSRDFFPNDTKKNPKDCMTITLRSGRELKVSKEAEKKQNNDDTGEAYQNSTSVEKKQRRSGISYENQ